MGGAEAPDDGNGAAEGAEVDDRIGSGHPSLHGKNIHIHTIERHHLHSSFSLRIAITRKLHRAYFHEIATKKELRGLII